MVVVTDNFRCRCGKYIDPTKNVSIGGEVVCTDNACRTAALTDALGPQGTADYEETRQRLLFKNPDPPP
jgi:hypothetical protein